MCKYYFGIIKTPKSVLFYMDDRRMDGKMTACLYRWMACLSLYSPILSESDLTYKGVPPDH